MTLLFGRLTQDFVNFSTIVASPSSGPDTLKAAGDVFLSAASLNATYLVYIGTSVS